MGWRFLTAGRGSAPIRGGRALVPWLCADPGRACAGASYMLPLPLRHMASRVGITCSIPAGRAQAASSKLAQSTSLVLPRTLLCSMGWVHALCSRGPPLRTTGYRQTGHTGQGMQPCSHLSAHCIWNRCIQGKVLTLSLDTKGSKQIAHSRIAETADSFSGRGTKSDTIVFRCTSAQVGSTGGGDLGVGRVGGGGRGSAPIPTTAAEAGATTGGSGPPGREGGLHQSSGTTSQPGYPACRRESPEPLARVEGTSKGEGLEATPAAPVSATVPDAGGGGVPAVPAAWPPGGAVRGCRTRMGCP